MTPDKDKLALAEKASRLLDGAISPEHILAVVYTESSGNPWAMRYEPAFRSHYIQPLMDRGEVKSATEAEGRATSWGLMQVMGQVAREQGFAGQFLTELCDPWVGIWFGAKHLARKVSKYGLEGGISAFNHGKPFEPLADDPYLKRVLANLKAIKDATG